MKTTYVSFEKGKKSMALLHKSLDSSLRLMKKLCYKISYFDWIITYSFNQNNLF